MTTEARLMKASNPYESIISGMTSAGGTNGGAGKGADVNGAINMHIDSESDGEDGDKPFQGEDKL